MNRMATKPNGFDHQDTESVTSLSSRDSHSLLKTPPELDCELEYFNFNYSSLQYNTTTRNQVYT